MTPEELQQLIDEFNSEQQKIVKRNEELLAAGHKNMDDYVFDYMKRESIRSDCILESTVEELLVEIDEFKKECNDDQRFKNNPTFEIVVTGEEEWVEDYSSCLYTDDIYLEGSVYTQTKSDPFLEIEKQKRLQKFLSLTIFEKVKSDKIKYRATVECKSLEAFLEGDLTWKGFIKQIYETCNIT